MTGGRESGSKPKKDMALVLPCIKAVKDFTHSKAKRCRKKRSTTNKKTRKYIHYNFLLVYRSVFLIIMAETDLFSFLCCYLREFLKTM